METEVPVFEVRPETEVGFGGQGLGGSAFSGEHFIFQNKPQELQGMELLGQSLLGSSFTGFMDAKESHLMSEVFDLIKHHDV